MAWLEDDILENSDSLSLFFGIPPAELDAMPPNSRLILQMGYAALQDAGIAPKSLSGQPWAIYTSMNESGWNEEQSVLADPKSESAMSTTVTAFLIAAYRASRA